MAERRIRRTDAQAMDVAQAAQAGAEFQWHFGRITRLGIFEVASASAREVTILWEEGGIISQQGNITDEQWEIFKLAFVATGRIAVLSDMKGDDWMYDYRFLEAVR
jgi:hypothetical protein